MGKLRLYRDAPTSRHVDVAVSFAWRFRDSQGIRANDFEHKAGRFWRRVKTRRSILSDLRRNGVTNHFPSTLNQ